MGEDYLSCLPLESRGIDFEHARHEIEVGNEILRENTDKGINCSFSIQVTHQTSRACQVGKQH